MYQRNLDDINTIHIWTAEEADLSLLQRVPQVLAKQKAYKLISSDSMSETWQAFNYKYIFAHALTDSGKCNYKFIMCPADYQLQPQDYRIEFKTEDDG